MKKSISEAKKLIRDLDEKTIDERAERLAELEPIELSGIEFELPVRMGDYIDEAIKTYIEKCYRSCIFCCSNAVEQAFKKEIIFSEDNAKDRKRVQEEIDNRMTFGKIIKKAEKHDFLSDFISDADWLKELRNKVAVHPIYISHGNIGVEPLEIEEWRKKLIKEDIETLLPFLDKENQKQMRDVLENPKALDDIFEWGLPEDIIRILALKAYKKMKRILEGIYH